MMLFKLFMFKKSLFFIPFIVFFISWGCSRDSLASSKPIVLVPILPYAYFTREIAGDLLKVETLIPPGINAHVYEPTPKAIQGMREARICFCCGIAFENKLSPFLKRSGVKVVSLLEGISCLTERGEEQGACQEEEKDIHTWLNPLLALEQVRIIFENLVRLFPQHQELFTKRYEELKQRLLLLDLEIEKELTSVRGSYVLISHPALAYYCARYGVHQIAVEHEGKEPRMQQVARTVQKAMKHQVKIVLTEPQHHNKGAEVIAHKLGLPIYEIDPYAEDYFALLSQVTRLMREHHVH